MGNGKIIRFFTVAGLVMGLVEANRTGGIEKMLSDIGKIDLFILDELGYVSLDIEGARLLYQVMANACEKQNKIIATNIEFSKWGTVFSDDKLAAAVMDRSCAVAVLWSSTAQGIGSCFDARQGGRLTAWRAQDLISIADSGMCRLLFDGMQKSSFLSRSLQRFSPWESSRVCLGAAVFDSLR